MPARRRAFTFIELIIVTGMIGAGVILMTPGIGRSREAANRIKCASNLRQIALGMKMYSNEQRNNALPRTKYDPDAADKPVAFTKSGDMPGPVNPFADDGPDANDVTAALFLVLRTQEITTDVFVCPSSAAERMSLAAGKNIQFYNNFDSQTHLSYSLSNPYASKEAAERGVKWDEMMNADFALMADMNPGGEAVTGVKFSDSGARQREANSRNHRRDGQNVMYADAHVDWSASVFAGAQQDNIFTFRKEAGSNAAQGENGGIAGSPVDDMDSVMLPAFDENVKMPNPQD